MRTAIVPAIIVAMLTSAAFSIPVVVQVGDNDGYGLGIADNAQLTDWPVSGAGDPTGMDCILNPTGAVFNPEWTVSFDLTHQQVLSGRLLIDAANIQDAYITAEDSLFVDGLEVVGAWDDVMQAPGGVLIPTDTEVFTFPLTPAMIEAVQDGSATVRIQQTGDSIFVDFLRLELEVIPEPASILLLALGSLAVLRQGRRQPF